MRKKKTIDYKKLAGLADEDTSDVQNVITKEEYFSSCSLCCSMRALSKSVKNDLLSNGQSLNEFILSFSAAQTELNFLSSEDQICDECFRYVCTVALHNIRTLQKVLFISNLQTPPIFTPLEPQIQGVLE